MDFDLSEQLKEKIACARRFAQANIAQRRKTGFDRDTWRAAAQFGLFTMAPDEAPDTDGRGGLPVFLLFEAMGRSGLDRSLLFGMGAHLFGCAVPFALYATPEQRAKWSDSLVEARIVGALAVTESTGGSSLGLIATQAKEAPNGYTLSGEKTLVCNAPEAGLFLVLARQFTDRGPLSFTMFLVPADAPGVSVHPISTMGLPGAPMGRLVCDGCFVPSDAILGRPGAGLRVFSTAMQWERTCLLAGFLGAAQRDLSLCVEALRSRGDAEGPVLRHQALSHRLARIKVKLESARLCGMHAAHGLRQRHESPETAAMAKLVISEAVVEAAQEMLKLMAGLAWRHQPTDLASALIDVIGGLSASGTSEIQLEIIARGLRNTWPA